MNFRPYAKFVVAAIGVAAIGVEHVLVTNPNASTAQLITAAVDALLVYFVPNEAPQPVKL